MNEQTPLDEQVVSPQPRPSHTSQIRTILLGVISVVLVLVAAGFAYMYTQKSKELAALQAADAPVGVAEPTQAPASPVDPSPKGVASSGMVRQLPGLRPGANPQLLTIKEWNVRLYLPADSGGQTYIYEKYKYTKVSNSMGFSHTRLAPVECKASSGALGVLTRYEEGSFPKGEGSHPVFIGRIKGFDYGFTAPQSMCGTSDELEEALNARLQGAVYSLEPIR